MRTEEEIQKMLFLWKRRFELDGWDITTLPILREQVLFPEDCPEEDRYFVGINSEELGKATIYHDRALTEEDIVHELLHLKEPSLTEEAINKLTGIIIKIYNGK